MPSIAPDQEVQDQAMESQSLSIIIQDVLGGIKYGSAQTPVPQEKEEEMNIEVTVENEQEKGLEAEA